MDSKRNPFSLDDFMHDLQKATLDTKGMFSTELLLSLLKQYLPEEEISKIEKYVILGETVPVNAKMFEPEYQLEWIVEPHTA